VKGQHSKSMTLPSLASVLKKKKKLFLTIKSFATLFVSYLLFICAPIGSGSLNLRVLVMKRFSWSVSIEAAFEHFHFISGKCFVLSWKSWWFASCS